MMNNRLKKFGIDQNSNHLTISFKDHVLYQLSEIHHNKRMVIFTKLWIFLIILTTLFNFL